jgi:pimeloyl-ACP methyl ester carboxylesterase
MHSSSGRQPSEFRLTLPHSGQSLAGLQFQGSTGGVTLALHGWLDNANSFKPLAPFLQGCGALHAIDWPGHGQSDHRPPNSFSPFLDYLGDLLGLLDLQGWSRVDLIGHSMGGAAATLFAATFPERVRRLVLIEAIGPLALPAERFVPQLRKALEARQVFRDKRRIYAALDEPIRARMVANQLSEPVARLLMERGTRPVDGGFQFTTDPRELLPSLSRGTEEQMLGALAQVQAPTQVILAEPATPYLSGPLADARLAALRPAEVHRLAGNHHLHMEHPEVVGPVVARFLSAGD